jgi:hypothetical protein
MEYKANFGVQLEEEVGWTIERASFEIRELSFT